MWRSQFKHSHVDEDACGVGKCPSACSTCLTQPSFVIILSSAFAIFLAPVCFHFSLLSSSSCSALSYYLIVPLSLFIHSLPIDLFPSCLYSPLFCFSVSTLLSSISLFSSPLLLSLRHSPVLCFSGIIWPFLWHLRRCISRQGEAHCRHCPPPQDRRAGHLHRRLRVRA